MLSLSSKPIKGLEGGNTNITKLKFLKWKRERENTITKTSRPANLRDYAQSLFSCIKITHGAIAQLGEYLRGTYYSSSKNPFIATPHNVQLALLTGFWTIFSHVNARGIKIRGCLN